MGNLFANSTGLSYKKDQLNKKSNSMIRVLRGGNIQDGNYIFKKDDIFISSEFVKQDLFLKKGYMITPAVTSLEHIGKIALIDKDYDNIVVGGFVLMLKPIFQYYIFYFSFQLIIIVKHAGKLHINRDKLFTICPETN